MNYEGVEPEVMLELTDEEIDFVFEVPWASYGVVFAWALDKLGEVAAKRSNYVAVTVLFSASYNLGAMATANAVLHYEIKVMRRQDAPGLSVKRAYRVHDELRYVFVEWPSKYGLDALM